MDSTDFAQLAKRRLFPARAAAAAGVFHPDPDLRLRETGATSRR
jgi:hypothetical protein